MKHAKAASAAGNGLASQNQHPKTSSANSLDATSLERNGLEKSGKGDAAATRRGKTDAIVLLKDDHRKVQKLFTECIAADDDAKKTELARQICTELIIHTKLEEELFYPACRDAGVAESSLDEAQVEHDGAKVMIADVMNGKPSDEFYGAKIKVLSEYIKHHIKEEEKPRTGVFARAKKAKLDTSALGERMQDRKDRLTAQKETLSHAPLEARSLHLQDIHTTQENAQMPRNNQGNRDQGRFTHDEDYGTGGRGYSPRGRSGSQRMDHDEDHDRWYGQARHSPSDYDRSHDSYTTSDHGRDTQHRYSYATNEDYPIREQNRDFGAQGRDRDWDRHNTTGRNYASRAGSRYDQDQDHDYSGSFRTDQGSRGGQYDRGQQSSQYSQSNYGQNRNQGDYNQGNSGQGSSRNQDHYAQSGSGQYGEDDHSSSRSGNYGQDISQQSQSRTQGRSQQTSQNRFRDDENHNQGYGGYGSPARREHGNDSDRYSDNDRFTRSTRRNPQYRD